MEKKMEELFRDELSKKKKKKEIRNSYHYYNQSVFNNIRFSNKNFPLQRKQLELYSLISCNSSSETLLNTCVP